MLESSIAIVIGPTPPGTGVIAPATWRTDSKSTSPDQHRLGAVGAHVDHHGARPTISAVTSAGRPDRGHQHVGLAATRRARSRVREWQG